MCFCSGRQRRALLRPLPFAFFAVQPTVIIRASKTIAITSATESDLLDRRAVESLAHFLARPEEGDNLLGHLHLVSGAGVPRRARLALLRGKSAEAAQLHTLAARQSVGYSAQNCINDVLDVALIEVLLMGRHALHEFRLDHSAPQCTAAESRSEALCPKSTSWIKPSLCVPRRLANSTSEDAA